MRHEANKRGGVGCSSDNKVYRPNEVKLREKKMKPIPDESHSRIMLQPECTHEMERNNNSI